MSEEDVPVSGVQQIIQNLKHEDVPVERLRQHPDNPNQGDFGAIYNLIRENGFYGELIVQVEEWRDEQPYSGVILAGNHRYGSAVELGYEKLPVAWIDVPQVRQMKILLGDNRASDLRDYDQQGVANILRSIYEEEGSLEGTGYDEDDFDQMVADLEFDEEVGDLEGTEERQWSPEERFEKQYISTDFRQIIVVMHQDEYRWALEILKEMQALEPDVETNTHAILLLLKRWREEHPDADATGESEEPTSDEGTGGLDEGEEADSSGGL